VVGDRRLAERKQVEILKQNLKGAGPATVAKGSELLARAEAAEAARDNYANVAAYWLQRAEELQRERDEASTQLGEALLREAQLKRKLIEYTRAEDREI
jgi:hypothetical protein